MAPGLGSDLPRAEAHAKLSAIDREALTALYRRYGPVVYRRALAILRDGDEAKDAMQEVFVRVVAEHASYRGDAPILRWIYRITTNLCLNRLRQRKAHPVVEDPSAVLELIDGTRSDAVDRRAVIDLLGSLDPITQQIVVYYYLDEMNMEEVAAAIGRSRKTVGKKLEGFKKKARRVLSDAPVAVGASR